MIVPLPNALEKWLINGGFLTTCPSGMILPVATSSVLQVAAFEASSPPQRGETRGLCSRKDAVQLEEKLEKMLAWFIGGS